MQTYKNIWQQWMESIEKYISKTHEYYNLITGITSEEVAHANTLLGFAIPDELIAFYRIYNVKYRADNSVFNFSIQNYPYALLPFKRIVSAYESLLDLDVFDDDEVQSSYKGNTISDRIHIEGFTNKGWIPFAETDQGDYLMFDTNPSDTGIYGQIIEFQNDSWERNLVADSLEELILNQISFIEKNNGSCFNTATLSDTITIDTITYKLISVQKALEIVKHHFTEANAITSSFEDTATGYFLVAESEVKTRSLVIHKTIPDTETIIYGYIFMEDIEVIQCLYANDEQDNVMVFALKNVQTSNLILNSMAICVKNTFHCEDVLCGKGKNSLLAVWGDANLNIVYAENCTMIFASENISFRAIIHNHTIHKTLQYYDNNQVQTSVEPILPTHNANEVFYDDYLQELSKGTFRLQWDEAFYTALKQNSFEDDNEYDAVYDGDFVDDTNTKAKEELHTSIETLFHHEKLTTNDHIEWHDKTDGICYQFSKNNDTHYIYFWHAKQNLSAEIHYTKGTAPMYYLSYMTKDNSTLRFQFAEALTEENILTNGMRYVLRIGTGLVEGEIETITTIWNPNLNTETVAQLINYDKIPENNKDGHTFYIDQTYVSIVKSYIDEDGDEMGNHIYIESEDEIRIFIQHKEELTPTYKTTGMAEFDYINAQTPTEVITFLNNIWPALMQDMQTQDNAWHGISTRLNIDDFQKSFRGYAIPKNLQALFHFETQYGAEYYAECFYLRAGEKITWFDSDEFANAFIEFACANGTGSFYALWLIDHDIEKCPVVVFGDEGGVHVVANTIKDLIHLLTLDSEIQVSHYNVYFYKDEDDYEPSEYRDEFCTWAKETLGLDALQTDKETATIIAQAKEKHQAKLDLLLKKFDIANQEESHTIYQLKLINRFGFGTADTEKVISLQKQFGFSDQYARFLSTYNGLNTNILDQETITEDNEFATKASFSPDDIYQTLTYLYGIGELEEYYDLEKSNDYNIFKNHFFIIGRDPGGNEFVEILHGKYKGYIGCIDHEMYAGNDSLEEFIKDMDLEDFLELNTNEQCNILSDEDLGLMALHAKSMKQFELEKLYIDNRGTVYVQEL